MTLCPLCDYDNIEGVDVCDGCGQSLTQQNLRPPRTRVEKGLLRDRIAFLQPKNPIVVAAHCTVGEVLKVMVDRSIGCVVVVDGERPVGIFSERDALRKLSVDAARHRDRPISEFMSTNPQMLVATAKVAFAVHRMDQGGFRHVPILSDGGQLVGIISVRDILRYLTSQLELDS